MKNFAITGVAGYIAPRHLEAIQATDNKLIAAIDPHDSVGILDRYNHDVRFFTEIERFDRHLEKLLRSSTGPRLDYLSICSPNYLHDAHIRLALRLGAHAICEKPLVANPWHLDALQELESESNKRVFGILQVRLHPTICQLKKQIEDSPKNSKYKVSLTYCTSRGPWYNYSWKGDEDKSGGIATNIGIHFFDLLIWLFGDVQENKVHLIEPNRMAGAIELSKANVSWFLSTEKKDLPEHIQKKQEPTYRSIIIDDHELEFSKGFNDLHTVSYTNILAGHGFDMTDARPSIELVYRIRNSKVTSNLDNIHPFVKTCG